jgi:HSP20 family protein
MSFLRKLKGEGIMDSAEDHLKTNDEEDPLENITQLDVDLYQTPNEIIIYAPIAGASLEKIHVSIEGDNDTVIIQGEKHRPEEYAHKSGGASSDGQFFSEEVSWGEFYRKIILPDEIDVGNAEANTKDGVLLLRLPLLKESSQKKVQLKIKTLDE